MDGFSGPTQCNGTNLSGPFFLLLMELALAHVITRDSLFYALSTGYKRGKKGCLLSKKKRVKNIAM